MASDQADREAERLLPCLNTDAVDHRGPCSPPLHHPRCPATQRPAIAARLRERDEAREEYHKSVMAGIALMHERDSLRERIAALKTDYDALLEDFHKQESTAEFFAQRVAALEAEVNKLNEIIASLDSAAHDPTHKSKSPTDNR